MMNRALKIVLSAYGVGLTMVGTLYIFTPREDVRKVLGASMLAAGLFLITAARDPIRHIQWVRFAIVFALLFVGVSVYFGLVRDDFPSVLDGILIHGTFAALLLVFFPRKVVRRDHQVASHDRSIGSVAEVTD